METAPSASSRRPPRHRDEFVGFPSRDDFNGFPSHHRSPAITSNISQPGQRLKHIVLRQCPISFPDHVLVNKDVALRRAGRLLKVWALPKLVNFSQMKARGI